MQTFGRKQKISYAFAVSTLSTDVWSRYRNRTFSLFREDFVCDRRCHFLFKFTFVNFVYLDFASWIHFSEFGLFWNYMPEPRDVVIWWTLTSIFYAPYSAHFVRHGLQTLSCKDFVPAGTLVKEKFPDPCSTLWGAEVEQRSTFATRRSQVRSTLSSVRTCQSLWILWKNSNFIWRWGAETNSTSWRRNFLEILLKAGHFTAKPSRPFFTRRTYRPFCHFQFFKGLSCDGNFQKYFFGLSALGEPGTF